ncbi:hypothetical protein GUITHDRAFT_63537, partial [Guillardia theta CCMP2712]
MAGKVVKRAFWENSFLDRSSLSDTLVLNLKRFTVQSQGGGNVKINDFLSFPQVIDLAPITRPVSETRSLDAPAPSSTSDDPLLYGLVGIIVHKGEATHGHYYSLVKHATGVWYKVDDEKVGIFEESQIAEECFGGVNIKTKSYRVEKKPKNYNAFVLFYRRMQ